ncbi:MAG: DUF6714 family protein [Fimbriimonas sp.]
MNRETPTWLHDEREALWEEIFAAFAKVDRKGGVSWSETEAIDGYRSDEERQRARKSDRERGWQALVDDPRWDPSPGVGAWVFLDAVGFRYYLPVGMMRGLRGEDNGDLDRHLLPSRSDGFIREKWAALDPRQRCCVRRYLLYGISMDEHQARKKNLDDWERELAMEKLQAAREVVIALWPCATVAR